MMSWSLRSVCAASLFAAAACFSPADAQQIAFEPRIGAFFELLYEKVVNGDLDLSPVYAAAGITVSDRACDPSADGEGVKACEVVPCPSEAALAAGARCLGRKGAGVGAAQQDLLILAPHPVRRIGDYDPQWNAFQISTLESKLGGRLPLIGLARMLALPGNATSGFFAFERIDKTSDGEAEVALWRSKSNGSRVCGAVWCFSLYRAVAAVGAVPTALSETIVECVERKVGDVTGAPQYCMPIYLRGTKGTFVSALISFRRATMKVDRGLVGARVFFDSGQDAPDLEKVALIVERAFARAPLSLSTSRDPGAVVGACDNHASEIIVHWRQKATVRAVMTGIPFSYGGPNGTVQSVQGIQVGLATTLYLNNRNTEDEWRAPSREQSDAFDAAVVATIKTEAAQSCPAATSQVRDGVTVINCPTGRW